MAQAKSGDTVRVHYTGKLDDGTVFGSSVGREPLEFTIGEGQIIPGFEQAVIGMNEGESKTVRVTADQAYGPRREEMMVEIDRSQVPAGLELEIGQMLQMQQPNGRMVRVIVASISETTVLLDANHPLAGKDLTFDIQLIQIV